MGFRLVPKLVTLNDLEQRNMPFVVAELLVKCHVKVLLVR